MNPTGELGLRGIRMVRLRPENWCGRTEEAKRVADLSALAGFKDLSGNVLSVLQEP